MDFQLNFKSKYKSDFDRSSPDDAWPWDGNGIENWKKGSQNNIILEKKTHNTKVLYPIMILK